jgi:hypothetical protein
MKIMTDLQRRIYRRLIRQSFSYFDKQDTGILINRTIGDEGCGGTDSHKNADVRGLLTPLSELAARHGVALDLRGAKDLPDALLSRLPPVGRMLLRPRRLGVIQRVFDGRAGLASAWKSLASWRPCGRLTNRMLPCFSWIRRKG